MVRLSCKLVMKIPEDKSLHNRTNVGSFKIISKTTVI